MEAGPDTSLVISWQIAMMLQLALVMVAFIDITKRQMKPHHKISWLLLIFFGLLAGPVIYFLASRRMEKSTAQ